MSCCHAVCVCQPSRVYRRLGGEGNALYPVLSSSACIGYTYIASSCTEYYGYGLDDYFVAYRECTANTDCETSLYLHIHMYGHSRSRVL